MTFTKMHGLGNDYVYVDGSVNPVDDPVALARTIADRHFGVGGDGLILILPSTVADVRMRMFNADGSESEMCGNGVRCVAKYAYDHGLTHANPMRVETGRGVLTLALRLDNAGKVAQVAVDMGTPILELEKIPVDHLRLRMGVHSEHSWRVPLPKELGELPEATCVSMGNPHAVFFVPDVTEIALERVGPVIETHPAFPRRINVHFAQVHGERELTMRTWERGSGVTLACGTGACAVAVAGVLTGRTSRQVLAHLPGGDLELDWREADNQVRMTGPAVEVFSGTWNG